MKPAIAILTLSDSRLPPSDESGALLRSLLEPHAQILSQDIVREDAGLLAQRVVELGNSGTVQAVVCTGGTGIAPRDRTVEELVPLFDKELLGFGEAFRRISFERIGPRAILSRATAGTIGKLLVFALPGSTAAVELAVTEILIPILGHALDLVAGRTHHHRSAVP